MIKSPIHKHLLYTSAIILLGTSFMSSPVRADEDCDKNGVCTEPEFVGKQSMDSRVSLRGIGLDAPIAQSIVI